MQLAITHTLVFSLGTPSRAVQHLLLTPAVTPQQRIERWSIAMPGFADAAAFRDGFGNRAHLVSQVKPEPELTVTVTGAVETIDRAGVLGRLDDDPPPALFRRPTEATQADAAFLDTLTERGKGRIATLHEIMGRLHRAEPAAAQEQAGQSQSQGDTAPAAPELTQRFIGAARALDIPARYVTGYLWHEGAGRVHAWAEAWDDGLGWIGFDPLLDLCPAKHHIRLASGLDAFGTMPIRAVPGWSENPAETVEITAR